MSDAAPKPWVKALRIKSTPWRVLVGLWGHGSYKADGPAFVWVNRRKLADEIGLPLGTLRNGLDALAAAGWIARDGGGWRLAWMTPYAFTRPADGPTRPADGPARPQADPARGEADPARPQADPRPARGPHELVGNFQIPSNHLADDASARRDTPDPEEQTHGDNLKSTDSGSALRGHAPDGGHHRGAVPGHVQASLARANGHDQRGAGRHRGGGDGAAVHARAGRLSPELVEAVAAAGDVWGVQLGHQRFEGLVCECVDDLGLKPEELTRGLVGWETMDRAKRPPRSQWLYGRNRPAFKAAAGLEAPAPKRGGPMFAMDGGLS